MNNINCKSIRGHQVLMLPMAWGARALPRASMSSRRRSNCPVTNACNGRLNLTNKYNGKSCN